MMGKPEEMKLRKLMRKKLQTTSIPDLEFEDIEGNFIKFKEIYEYRKYLGAGSFGFVVSAIGRDCAQYLALKIVDKTNETSADCLLKEAEILQSIPHHPNIV
mmetsp:Transcript_23879/g.23561  ORF Transcript_23879/g.23561 Transcript_23879/m.23561 type:complete len:102 (+) Transcript_23879:140-445(+)